jgi:HrpA-like RNA helicase
VIDEIHERGVDSDFLIVVLRGLLALRPDLRVVLMSATLDAGLFAGYFAGANAGAPCPVVDVPGRTFPVRKLFVEDALAEMGGSIADMVGSARAPPG